MSDAPGLNNFKESIAILPEEEKAFIKDESKHGRFIYADQVYDARQTNTLPILNHDDHRNSSPRINRRIPFQPQNNSPPPPFIIPSLTLPSSSLVSHGWDDNSNVFI